MNSVAVRSPIYWSFLNFVENTVVHERNLLEKWDTHRGYHFGTGC